MAALALSAIGAGCRPHLPPPSMDPTQCKEEVEALFGPQEEAVLVLRARDNAPVFRPQILHAIDRVCREFEDAATDTTRRVQCITNLPLMEARPGGARMVVPRDEFPLDIAGALRIQRLLLEVEFAVGAALDPSLTRTWIYLPRSSFAGVELRDVLARALAQEPLLEAVLDDNSDAARPGFRRIAGEGPSASTLVGLYDSGRDGGMKEPLHLLALERFQVRAEGFPHVTETFTLADDIKLVRRGLRKGIPAEAILPPTRTEVAQLLLALALAPGASDFGVRVDGSERVGIVRINVSALDLADRANLAARLEEILVHEAADGARAVICRPQ